MYEFLLSNPNSHFILKKFYNNIKNHIIEIEELHKEALLSNRKHPKSSLNMNKTLVLSETYVDKSLKSMDKS